MDVGLWPDGNYSHGATFVNASDRAAWESTFRMGTDGQRRMAVAMITANPNTSEDEIRAKLSSPPPPAPGPVSVTQMTLDDVLAVGATVNSAHLYDRSPSDFSGSPAGRDASSVPSISVL